MNKTEARKILTMGNHKLGASIASFTLPATQEVCGRECNGCYAIKAQRIYPATLPSRSKKLDFSKREGFVDLTIKAINTLKPKYVRPHDAGEFYSQEYIHKWSKIAKALPNQKFYAYTKRMKDFNFKPLTSLKNFVIIDSLHSGKINYGKLEDRPKGMFQCPDYKGSLERQAQPKGPICGVSCHYCMGKEAEKTGVYFCQH